MNDQLTSNDRAGAPTGAPVILDTPPAAAPPPQPGPTLFGYAPLPLRQTRIDARWLAATGPASVGSGPWDSVLARTAGQAVHDRVTAVNVWANHFLRFSPDADTWGVGDRWSGLEESVARGRGDCEDFALAKMRLLQASGVSANDLYLVLVRDERRAQDHAVLVVRDAGRLYVLDSANDRVAAAEEPSDYRPVLGFGSGGRWTFGKPSPVAVGVAAAGLSR